MSKRFGRNQRRRAREALAVEVQHAADAMKMAQDRLDMYHSARRESAEMREFFKYVARRVGKEAHIARGVGIGEIRQPGQQLRAAVYEELDFSRVAMSDPMATSRMMTETLHHLETRVVRDAFRREMLFEVYLYGKSAGYALSESLIHRAEKEELVAVIQNSITPMLAHHLATALKGK